MKKDGDINFEREPKEKEVILKALAASVKHPETLSSLEMRKKLVEKTNEKLLRKEGKQNKAGRRSV